MSSDRSPDTRSDPGPGDGPSEGADRETASARSVFRVLTRTRTGYDHAVMYDVQLQVVATGALVWAQTFSDEDEANTYREDVQSDLDALDDAEFRRRWSVPSST